MCANQTFIFCSSWHKTFLWDYVVKAHFLPLSVSKTFWVFITFLIIKKMNHNNPFKKRTIVMYLDSRSVSRLYPNEKGISDDGRLSFVIISCHLLFFLNYNMVVQNTIRRKKKIIILLLYSKLYNTVQYVRQTLKKQNLTYLITQMVTYSLTYEHQKLSPYK